MHSFIEIFHGDVISHTLFAQTAGTTGANHIQATKGVIRVIPFNSIVVDAEIRSLLHLFALIARRQATTGEEAVIIGMTVEHPFGFVAHLRGHFRGGKYKNKPT